MKRLLFVLAFLALPALARAAPCVSRGAATAAKIAFPKGDGTDQGFARLMPPVLAELRQNAVAVPATCERGQVSTAAGDYLLTGETRDPLPRRALPANGTGPSVFLLWDGGATPGETYMLVVQAADQVAHVRAFFNQIPEDEAFGAAVRDALASDRDILSFNPADRAIFYNFSTAPARTVTTGAPHAEVMLFGTTGQFFEQVGYTYAHQPSGLVCPEKLEGLEIGLMNYTPAATQVKCEYKTNAAIAYNAADTVRYRLTVARRPGVDAETALGDLIATADRLWREHEPQPKANLPEGAFGAFYIHDGRTTGTWFADHAGWLVTLDVDYPPSPQTDAEAAKVAEALLRPYLTGR